MASVHRETFVDFVKGHGWRRGAELGVDKGILTGMLLRECPDLHLTAVDVFPDMKRSHRVFELQAGYSDRCEVLTMKTDQAASLFENDHFDFVFIDADHSYEAVKSDILRWYPKIKPGGWIGGHDYDPAKFPGVVKAVDSHFLEGVVHHLPGTIWGAWV